MRYLCIFLLVGFVVDFLYTFIFWLFLPRWQGTPCHWKRYFLLLALLGGEGIVIMYIIEFMKG